MTKTSSSGLVVGNTNEINDNECAEKNTEYKEVYMKVELNKREIGFIVVALSRYIKLHELFTDIRELNMSAISLYLHDLHDASRLAIRFDAILKGDELKQEVI